MENDYEMVELPQKSVVPDTPRIIEKYTNEEGQVDVEKMASKMSSITQQNFTFKRMFLYSSLFLVVMVGLMISANIIGAIFLKDSKVKDNQLVTKNNNPISIDAKMYKVPVYLFSSEDVLSGLKYLEVPVEIDGTNSTLHMRVDTFINIHGKQIIFVGEKYCLILERHTYELILNDGSFDPLSLNATKNTDVNTDINEMIESNDIPVKRIYKSQRDTDGKKRIHLTQESHKKRVELYDPTQEFVYLSGKGTVSAPAVNRATFLNLNYHSGQKLVTNGKAVIIIWNDQTNGNFAATNLKTCYNSLPTFYNDLLKTKLFTELTPGKKGNDPQSKVIGVDQTVHYLTPSSARRKKTLSDSDISNQLIEWLSVAYDAKKPNSTIPKDTTNKLNYMYNIFFPSGIKLSSGFCNGYCGFHTYRNDYIYSVLPWVGDCINSCGSSSYVSSFGGNICGSLHSVASHELTEMATDPYLKTYYDTQGYENADKCAWTTPACYKSSTGNSYCVQQAWNHTAKSSTANDAGCTKNFQN